MREENLKRGMSKLLSTLLIATLVFTSASAAFAGAEEGQSEIAAKSAVADNAATAEHTVASKAAAAVNDVAVKTKATVTGSFDLVTITSKADLAMISDKVATIAYGPDDSVGNGVGYAQKVKIPAKGTVIVAAQTASGSATGAYFGLYRDAQLTQSVGYDGYASTSATEPDTTLIQVPAAGTYYLGVRSSAFASGQVTIATAAVYINGGNRNISSGKEILVGQKDAQTNYFKFKAGKTGYLQVKNVGNGGYNKVVLCNRSKKALSGGQYLSYNPTFGVKKGTTYYLKIKANSNSNGGYIFKVTNKAIKEKSGTSKKKATALKKKKAVSGTVIAGNGQADWYKFNLTGKKNVNITAKGAVSGTLKLEVYQGSKKLSGNVSLKDAFNVKNKDLSLGKWSKGTYYVKISRTDKKSSGYYRFSLSWK